MTYYTRGFTGTEHGLIKVEQFQALDEKVGSAFDLLVGEADLKTDTMTSAVAVVSASTSDSITYRATMPYQVLWPPRGDPDGSPVLRDQLRISLRFPVTNPGPANLELLDSNGNSLGVKPIRQVNAQPLDPGHIGQDAEALLAYADVGAGYWTIMGAARGLTGRTGPPNGTFSLATGAEGDTVFAGDLLFTATAEEGGTVTNLGPAVARFRGLYDASTAYRFLDIVRDGTRLFLHQGATATTGTGTSDTTVWVQVLQVGSDGAFYANFNTSTTAADPGAGKVAFNNATVASITRIYLDAIDADGNDLASWVDTWDNYGDASLRGQIVMRSEAGTVLVFALTAVTTRTGYRELTVSHIAGASLPASDALVSIIPLLRGQDGTDGNDGDDATVPDASVTVKGKVELATAAEAAAQTDTNKAVTPARLRNPFTAITRAATLVWNVAVRPNATVSLTGNVSALTLQNSQDGGVYTLLIKQDGTGGRTFTFPSGWKWRGGTADSIASAANAETLLTIRNIDGTIYAAPLLKGLA